MRRILVWFRAHSVRKDVATILHLGLWARLLHPKARRPVAGVVLGVLMMLAGSLTAHSAGLIEAGLGVHHLVVDTVGYFVHAVGAIPAIRYIDPFWTLVLGAAD